MITFIVLSFTVIALASAFFLAVSAKETWLARHTMNKVDTYWKVVEMTIMTTTLLVSLFALGWFETHVMMVA